MKQEVFTDDINMDFQENDGIDNFNSQIVQDNDRENDFAMSYGNCSSDVATPSMLHQMPQLDLDIQDSHEDPSQLPVLKEVSSFVSTGHYIRC